ncbi:phage tail protein [Pseudomonas sp. NPDC088322]|uniref:phage tail protein n=1 Tax=Pseudomonas sp. NPDC088322 TaxID=3364452 RepID=UPI0037F9C49C
MGAAAHLVIAGEKGGEKKPKTPVEAPDSLRSTNIAKILLAVGEGEFDGTPTARDIYLDNTPIMDASGNLNFPGVRWEWRPGSVEQDYIQGIPSVENETTVNVELRADHPFTRTLSNTQLSAIRVRLAWPRLVRQDSSGNTNGYRIEYAIDVSTDGGAFVESVRSAVDGKTTSGYQRSERVNLPPAISGWSFRIRRLTPNSNTGTIADTMTVAGYTEIIDQKLRYPNTALLYIEFDAEQFQNIPAVTVNCNGQRWPVPSNYDPVTRTYTGVWDGTFKLAWTNNPVWATYGLCVNDRFGLGKRIQSWMVDKWEMYRIGQYCDQLVSNGVGGMEPRYLCDLNLQGKAEAWTLLRDLSAIYRGMVYWAQGSLYMQADMPRAQDIDYTFTRSNVIDGDFVYGGAGRDTHYSRALISYDNPANNYDTDVIPVTDNALQRRYRDRPIEISAIGCTRASEAQRRGKWALLSNNQDRTVTFKTGMEGAAVLPGFVIPVADELVAGRPNGGRISAVAGRTVTLDRDTPVKSGDRLIVNLPNGTAQARTVQSVAGRAVTVTTAYTLQPEPQLQWAIDYEDLAVQLFRVLKRKRTAEGEYEFTALEFNPSKFAAIDNGAKLEERPISVIPITTVPAPASVTLTSGYAVDQGIAVSTMTIEWPAVEGAVAYDVEWRKDNGNWIRLQRVGTTSVDITGIYAGAYLARVRAVSAFDITSIWRDSMLTELKGKEGVPPSVTFLAAESLLLSIAIRWGIPPGAEDTQRTELWYSQSNSLDTATKLADLAYPQAEYVMQGLRAGVSFFFWARLVDRTGNIGPWYPVGGGVLGQSGSDASPVLELISGQVTESELGQELLKEIEKISGDFPGSVNDRINEAKQELEELITELTDPLEYVATNAYAKDDVVRSGRRLYMAVVPVPAAADGSNAPPNPTYWVDIGSIAATANGLAQAVAKNTTAIATVDGKVMVTAAMLQAVQSAYRDDNGEGDLADAMRGWGTLAKVSEESRTRATQNEAMASRTTAVEARVAENTGSIRSLEQTVVTNEQATASRFSDVNTKVGSNTAGISQLEKAVTDNETSTASRLQTVNARVDDAETAISEEELARVTGDESLGQRLGIMEASFTSPQGERDDNGEGDLAGALKSWESTAKIADESKVRATAVDVLARRSETLEVSIADTNAAVQTVSQAQATLDGKANLMWAVKMQLNAQGQYVAASIGLGIENGPGGLQSQFLVSADRFAVVNGINGVLSSPFAVQGGQVFINEAFIADGTITNAKIGSFISSTNYVAGQQGWILNKSGTLEINGTVAGQGRLTITNQRIRIYHANGNLAIDLGVNV